MPPKNWIEAAGAIGIQFKSGRHGGAFAHAGITIEFASWISPELKLDIIKDYKRLKTDESRRLEQERSAKRKAAKTGRRMPEEA
jgi:hypothetical protein